MTKISNHTRIALLLGAAVIVGGSTLAYAHMDGPMPPDGPMQGLLHRGKLSERLLAEFDSNKDGKITRAEFNNVLGTRFAMATHKKPGMTDDQFKELMAVIGMASETNKLVTGYQVEIDEQFKTY